MNWAEILEDKFLNSLDWRIESDRWGNVVMSPPPRSRHGESQFEIGARLHEGMSGGRVVTECPIQTNEGVKAADVAWVSHARRASKPNNPVYLVAPEICVEVESPAQQPEEIAERRRLFFEQGAQECWVCGLFGGMTFFDQSGEIPQSRLCANFPKQIDLD
jgi:Uma2 family endonuclease